ncbi:efflux RND transporter permease subunit [Clostridium vincentii]|uniref:Swarming motility protein SwrC n=1 Tax=Clostridium vincentii TaxID=52704 RepID=A0A2T0BDR7_9CLOT|nr:efflux RND transporter permease subunit [Clostridium vincentii]PRR82026.1 Swarming motility protein SwrC [Clostridium vincentii]
MLSKFSVKKPLTIVVSVILVVILGIISFTSMTTDLLPKIDLPYVVVMTTYPGASPEKVEIAVTKPLEQVLSTTSGIKGINSVSSENSSMLILEFNQEVNMDSAMIDLSGKVDLVKAQLDVEVGSPMLMKLNPDMLPIMVASIDVNNLDINETSKLVKEEIMPVFERIDGVGSVEATGLLEENIKVTLDSKKIDDLNNRVLKSVDSKLAEAKAQIDSGKAKVADGKILLAKESASKTEQLVDGSMALETGKDQLESVLTDLPKLQQDLETQRAELVIQKTTLEALIKWQEENEIPVVEEEKTALAQFNDGIKAIDEGLVSIKEQKPTLDAKLKEIVSNEKKLEVGKLTLNQELTKAAVTLSTAEAELEKATKEFESARDEAYEKANLSGTITKDIISKLLMAQNFSMPAGYIKEGNEQYIVKVGDEFTSFEELKNLALFNIDVDGIGEVKIEDIGTVEYADNAEEMYAKINGNDGIILSFQKQSTASTSKVSKKINENIETLMNDNKDMHITPLQDQGVYIDVVIDSVLNNLLLGGILAVIILLIFLKSIKPTIIIAFSIPISLLFAVTMMYFSGVTMNVISLAGLALGVGMLVDNSIVVIENIYRLKNQGMSSAKASVKGATQVAGAIAASTLTTICVFLPIVFTQGISRQLFSDMGLTIAYSLIASLIVALTLVPTMASTVLKKDIENENKFFNKIVHVYEKVLAVSLKHRAIVLITVVVLLAGSAVLTIAKGTILMPETDSTQISVSMEMPKGSDLNETREMSNTLVDRITSIQDVETVGAIQSGGMDTALLGMSGGKRNVSLYVLLKEDKDLLSKEVGELIANVTSDLDCDITINTSTMDMSALGGSGVEVIIKGNDLDKLREISRDVTETVEGTEGTKEVSDGLGESTAETRITVDKNKAMSYGLTVAQVYQDIAIAIKDETKATTLNVSEKEYPIILIDDQESKINRESLKYHTLTVTKDGVEEEISLSDIATIEEAESLSSIRRESQVRTLSVKAAIDNDHNVGLVSDEIERKLESYDVPEGYSVEIGGEKESINDAFTDLIKMIALAIIFIYLIMVAQFQSLLSPFIVLFTIPLAFTGGFLALLITGFELSMISMLGFLMLSGIVVNNGIVFVDYVNQLRLEGIEKKDALILTGKARIRPILMTALTTILGLSTLAIGIGMGADMIQPMAIVTIGGLTYATMLTLFVVPIMYDLLHSKELKVIIIEEEDKRV